MSAKLLSLIRCWRRGCAAVFTGTLAETGGWFISAENMAPITLCPEHGGVFQRARENSRGPTR